MTKTTLKIDGMACGMCEAHVNDALRKAFDIKKISSSHSKGETVIISEQPLSHTVLEETLAPTGYRLLGIEEEPYVKRGLFSFGK